MQTPGLLPDPDPRKRVQVLVPFPLAKAYDYALPPGMTARAGDIVRVPLGKKETAGVVWREGAGDAPDSARIRHVLRVHDCPPMRAPMRAFVEKLAAWTMADPGAVLKMCLPVADALDPPQGGAAYALPAAPPERTSPQRRKILDYLAQGGPRGAAEIAQATGASPAVIRAMARAGQLAAARSRAIFPAETGTAPPSPLALSAAQESAAAALRETVDARAFRPVVLDGVTGSGKTEVYFEAVARALDQGRQVLILLPEISLSAQFTQRFERRFGMRPALWHSGVGPAQRRLVWRGVAEGRTRVVAGARSALFLPFADPGLIIVDEEHDASYKQEDGVPYHARDMAVLRAKLEGIPVVLVSATPSLETVVNAQKGRYALLRLPERARGAALPGMRVVDMRKTPPPRQRFLSPPLRDALQEVFAAGEQSLLFLNRRGYAPLTLCRACGHRFQCPSCTAWLVEHRRRGRMQCHHCGYSQRPPAACPACGEQDCFAACGPGVERIEEEVREALPAARSLVLASDITGGAGELHAALERIGAGEVDVIIGTQIIAKGHHFPALTLVGVVDADLGLAGGDLRAGERTFQLLHQVAGRAGRAQKPGRVFLQTHMPDQAVMKTLAAHDRDGFLAVEAREREAAGMPPFGRLAAIVASGPRETELDRFCRALARAAPRCDGIRVLGPAPAPIALLRGQHRRRFLVKAARGVAVQPFVASWMNGLETPARIRVKIDIDPQSFF